MAYFLLFVVLFCFTTKGFCGKKTSCYVKNTGDAYLFNLVRMFLCIVIGIVLVFVEQAQKYLLVDAGMLWICILSGVANAAFLVGWMMAIRRNTMVSVDVGLTLGSLIPAVLGAIFFAETMSIPKMIGFALIVVATFVLSKRAKEDKKGGFIAILLLIFATVGDGMIGFAQQLYKQCYTEAGVLAKGVYYPNSVYQFYTYVFAAATLLILFCIYKIFNAKKKAEGEEKAKTKFSELLPPRALIYIFIMAVCLFAGNYVQTMVTTDYGMSSQMLYPIIKGGCLITVNFTAMIFFGEKITVRSVIGSIIALAGIVSMSIL